MLLSEFLKADRKMQDLEIAGWETGSECGKARSDNCRAAKANRSTYCEVGEGERTIRGE
jgi:hypothetical protein